MPKFGHPFDLTGRCRFDALHRAGSAGGMSRGVARRMATTEAKRAEGAQPQAAMTADYVIVGGGAAGAVLARRRNAIGVTTIALP
jgi:hypothetical protein